MGSSLDTEQAHSKKRTCYFKLIQSIKLSLTLHSRTSQRTVTVLPPSLDLDFVM